jgi:hypothetical protein
MCIQVVQWDQQNLNDKFRKTLSKQKFNGMPVYCRTIAGDRTLRSRAQNAGQRLARMR